MLKQFWNDESGATAAEYLILLALIIFAMVLAVQTFGTDLQEMFEAMSESLDGSTDLIESP